MEKQIVIDNILSEANGSWKDIAEEAYDAGYKAALSKAEDKGEWVRTIDGCLTCVHNIDTFEGNSFCIHNCYKGSRYELDVCKVQPSRASQPTNSLDELERWVKEQYQGDQEKGRDAIIVGNNILRLVEAKIQSLKTITPNNGWISVEDRLPEMITGKEYSENVIVWLNEERKIMNYALLPDDNNNLCYAWCMVYDGLDGDAEFDDNYYPTHWQPLPPKP